ncbi:MAG: 23S rRNA (guanosine(2251)-2'-O)-methyltransferase RlmB [Bryobacteraceae bacterium]|nr:23S rRNA (guanosine(2251)-2'-O)-methyltransferase RlmB [Bryobacteraceae bacterium]MDW8378675.1 23S rRNA (guanosine(2251)-2'-O)-methyltransferase RlmB [Bryobacterales bacterium]
MILESAILVEVSLRNRILAGIHPVREALLAGRPIEKVVIAKGAGGLRLQEIIELCRQSQVPVRFEPRDSLDRTSPGAAHQGVIAFAAEKRYASAEEIVGRAQGLVLLDGVEDPHNLGAIIRTAHAAGAGGVIIPERRAVGLTEVVAKSSAGALEHLPVARVANLRQELNRLKESGYWIYGLDERGSLDYDQTTYSTPTAFVLGGEGKGLHEHVRKHCDFLIRIPMAGAIASLNVSVAAGIVLFEWRRQLRARSFKT